MKNNYFYGKFLELSHNILKKRILNILREFWKIRFLENILVKFTMNKKLGTLITKLPPNHYQYKSGSLRKLNRNGINYELDISDVMGWHVYFGFKDVTRVKLYSLIGKSNTIFDVGANIGETTLNFAKIIGETGTVHSFEPDPINHTFIERNINLNNFKNILLFPLGFGDVEGTFKIHTFNERNKGMNRIIIDTDNTKSYREIKITTIDSYVKDKNIQKIDLIKIDVEGFEFNVLRGATKTLTEFNPILFIELDNENLRDQKSNSKELITFLENKGYNIFHSETNQKITSNMDFSLCHYDIIAKSNSKKEKLNSLNV
jgi:FkbM family methyltransferase